MKYIGTSTSSGIAIGKIKVYRPCQIEIPPETLIPGQEEAELSRFFRRPSGL